MKKKTKRLARWVNESKNQNIKKLKFAGIHLIADFWNGKIIEDEKKIKKILTKTARKAKNTPLEITIHKFNPRGMTGVLLLAESHIALHSWPEFHYLAIDIFTCGDKANPYKALKYLKKVFKPRRIGLKIIKRGFLPTRHTSTQPTHPKKEK